MILKLDFDSEVPIYLQIKNQIIIGIASKELQNGDELPSVRGLAEDIGVNMHTVNKSYALLKDEGYIKIDRRKGAIISLDFSYSNELFKNRLNEDLEIYIAECINRGILLNELKNKIEDVFNKYRREE